MTNILLSRLLPVTLFSAVVTHATANTIYVYEDDDNGQKFLTMSNKTPMAPKNSPKSVLPITLTPNYTPMATSLAPTTQRPPPHPVAVPTVTPTTT